MDIRATHRTKLGWGLFFERLGTLLLSILLALIAWLTAINQENPLVQDVFGQPIPITVRGLSEDLQPIQDLSKQTVRLTLRAPRSSWDSLESDDFDAYIDLAGKGPGTHDVDVQVDVVDPKVDILALQLPQLRIQLDRVTSKDVPVRVAILDSPAFGYEAQTPVVEPTTVRVSGPATQVDQVTVARAEVFLEDAKSQVESAATVEMFNGQNQSVGQVEADPAVVRVVVPIEQRPGRKEVSVRPNLSGEPAPGYRLGAVRVTPPTVVLLGSTEDLAVVPGFVETAEFSIAAATETIEQRVNLIVPSGATVAEGTQVTVTADIAPIEGGRTVKQQPVFQNLGAGLEARASMEPIEVILRGPVPLLESMEPDDMFVVLDLTGLLPGTHVVRPEVLLPDGINDEGVLPETVEVIISIKETPTSVAPANPPSPEEEPTATPTASPTAPSSEQTPGATRVSP